MITLDQLKRIKEIIAKYHAAMIQRAVGLSALTRDEVALLTKHNLIARSLGLIKNSYLYGHILGREPKEETAEMTSDAFETYTRKTPLVLSEAEQRAVIFAEEQAAQRIRGLGNRVAEHTGRVLIEADQQQRLSMEGMIREQTSEALVHRKTATELKLKLGHASEDWTRDWDRIAVTEQHTAQQAGLADEYLERHGGEEWVFKRPMPDACEHCKRLHLGPDGVPRIFRLSTLYSNGHTNEGRLRADWLAVVGSTHPWCQCQLGRVPPGWGFDRNGTLVPGGTYGVREREARKADPVAASLSPLESRGRFGLDSLRKSTGLPPGTVHTWADGQQWEKGEDGRWRPHGQAYHAGVEDVHAEGARIVVGGTPLKIVAHHGEHVVIERSDGSRAEVGLALLRGRGVESQAGPPQKGEPAAPNASAAHLERVDLTRPGWLESLPRLQRFGTGAQARAYARAIGWPATSAYKLPPVGDGGRWTLVEGERQALTSDAARALEAMPEGTRPKPVRSSRAKRETEERSPDALPHGAGRTIDALARETGVDLGGVDPGVPPEGLYERVKAAGLPGVDERKLKQLADTIRTEQPGRAVRAALELVVQATRPKTWDELGTSLAFLFAYPGLEGLGHSKQIHEAGLEEEYNRQAEEYADQLADSPIPEIQSEELPSLFEGADEEHLNERPIEAGEALPEDTGPDPWDLDRSIKRERFYILEKGTRAAIGTVHRWADGREWQKQPNGHWKPVHAPEHAGVPDRFAQGSKLTANGRTFEVKEHHGDHVVLEGEGGQTIRTTADKLSQRSVEDHPDTIAAPQPSQARERVDVFSTKITAKVVEQWRVDMRRLTKLYKSVNPPSADELWDLRTQAPTDEAGADARNARLKEFAGRFGEAREALDTFTHNFQQWTTEHLVPIDDTSYAAKIVRDSVKGLRADFHALFPTGGWPDYGPNAEQMRHEGAKKLQAFQRRVREVLHDAERYIETNGRELDRHPVLARGHVAGVTVVIEGHGRMTHRKPEMGTYEDDIKEFTTHLENARRMLESAGLGRVLDGLEIRIKLKSNARSADDDLAAGLYQRVTDRLSILPLGLAGAAETRYETLIHELGHRLYFRLVSPVARREWHEWIDSTAQPITPEAIDDFIDTVYAPEREQQLQRDPQARWVWRGGLNNRVEKAPESKRVLFQELANRIVEGTEATVDQIRTRLKESTKGERVYREPITHYGATNAEEAFAEAFQRFVIAGRRTLGPETRAHFERFVRAAGIELKKSIDPVIGAAGSPAGDRAVDTGSSGLNVKLGIVAPPRKRSAHEGGGYGPSYEELHNHGDPDFPYDYKRSREYYEIPGPLGHWVRPYVPFPGRFEASQEVVDMAPEKRAEIELRAKRRVSTELRNDAPTVKEHRKRSRKPRPVLVELTLPGELTDKGTST